MGMEFPKNFVLLLSNAHSGPDNKLSTLFHLFLYVHVSVVCHSCCRKALVLASWLSSVC